MKANLVVVHSMQNYDWVSLRGANNEPVQQAVTDAGFKAGDKVVLISEEDYKALEVYRRYASKESEAAE